MCYGYNIERGKEVADTGLATTQGGEEGGGYRIAVQGGEVAIRRVRARTTFRPVAAGCTTTWDRELGGLGREERGPIPGTPPLGKGGGRASASCATTREGQWAGCRPSHRDRWWMRVGGLELGFGEKMSIYMG